MVSSCDLNNNVNKQQSGVNAVRYYWHADAVGLLGIWQACHAASAQVASHLLDFVIYLVTVLKKVSQAEGVPLSEKT